jgi:hypothetical protein
LNTWGLYRVIVDDYMYYYDTLEEACERVCVVLYQLNLQSFWDKGVFEETKNLEQLSKIKKYVLNITHPKLNITIHYKGKDPLLPELVLYYLKLHINKKRQIL